MHRPRPDTPVAMTYADTRRLHLGGRRLTVRAISEFTDLSPSTVRRICDAHLVPVTRDGRPLPADAKAARRYDLLAFLDAYEMTHEGGLRRRAAPGAYGERGVKGLAEEKTDRDLAQKARSALRRNAHLAAS